MSRIKKILLKTGSFPRMSETFITNHLEMLYNNNFFTTILVGKKLDIDSSSQVEIINKNSFLDRTFEIVNYDVSTFFKKVGFVIMVLIKTPSSFKYLKTFFLNKYGVDGKSGKLFYMLFQVKDYLDFDIIHIQYAVNTYPFITLKKYNLLKSKIVLTCHGFDVHFTQENLNERIRYFKDVFLYSSLVTVNSLYLKEKVIKLGCQNDKLKRIPMPVNINYFTYQKKVQNDIIKLVSVGRLIKLKGHIYGIRVVNELKNRGYKIKYTIIGDGPFKSQLLNEIHYMKLTEEVVLSGSQNQDYIKKKLHESDIFLMTSIPDDDGREEAFGLVSIEAQACGIPVVAFNSGGVSETIIDGVTGFLVQEIDEFKMTDSVEKLIKDFNKRCEMGRNARNMVENRFSLESYKLQWKELYKELNCN